MGWDGAGNVNRNTGVFSGTQAWQNTRDGGRLIRADDHDTHDQDLADSIEKTLNRDGENSPTTNISWNSNKITSLANGTDGTDAANLDVATPRGYIDGLIISNNTTDSAHDIDISAGVCKDSTDARRMGISATLIKRIDADWVVGTNQGGFPSGLTLAANTWYHTFLIAKTDGTTDAGYDTSLTATNLLADATGYTLFRRIGSVLTDASSNILGFQQRGSWFLWNDQTLDYGQNNPGTSPVTVTLTVPPDVRVLAKVIVYLSVNSATYMRVAYGESTPTATTSEYTIRLTDGLAASDTISYEEWTNTSKQIKFDLDVSNASTVVQIQIQGWYDLRGKDS